MKYIKYSFHLLPLMILMSSCLYKPNSDANNSRTINYYFAVDTGNGDPHAPGSRAVLRSLRELHFYIDSIQMFDMSTLPPGEYYKTINQKREITLQQFYLAGDTVNTEPAFVISENVGQIVLKIWPRILDTVGYDRIHIAGYAIDTTGDTISLFVPETLLSTFFSLYLPPKESFGIPVTLHLSGDSLTILVSGGDLLILN